MFLAHYVGGGIDSILDLYTDEFFEYLEAALELFKNDLEIRRKTPIPAYLVQVKK